MKIDYLKYLKKRRSKIAVLLASIAVLSIVWSLFFMKNNNSNLSKIQFWTEWVEDNWVIKIYNSGDSSISGSMSISNSDDRENDYSGKVQSGVYIRLMNERKRPYSTKFDSVLKDGWYTPLVYHSKLVKVEDGLKERFSPFDIGAGTEIEININPKYMLEFYERSVLDESVRLRMKNAKFFQLKAIISFNINTNGSFTASEITLISDCYKVKLLFLD